MGYVWIHPIGLILCIRTLCTLWKCAEGLNYVHVNGGSSQIHVSWIYLKFNQALHNLQSKYLCEKSCWSNINNSVILFLLKWNVILYLKIYFIRNSIRPWRFHFWIDLKLWYIRSSTHQTLQYQLIWSVFWYSTRWID